MADIFDNTILCKHCAVEMKSFALTKNGFMLRAIACPKCSAKIIHPKDEQEYQNFLDLRKKQYSVKMRFVGNSYAISIPREIVNFIKDHERIVDDMVKLALQDFGKLSLDFGCQGNCNNKDKITKIQEIN